MLGCNYSRVFLSRPWFGITFKGNFWNKGLNTRDWLIRSRWELKPFVVLNIYHVLENCRVVDLEKIFCKILQNFVKFLFE